MSWPAWSPALASNTPDKEKKLEAVRCARGSVRLIAHRVGPPLIGLPRVGYRQPDDDGARVPQEAGGGYDDVVSRTAHQTDGADE